MHSDIRARPSSVLVMESEPLTAAWITDVLAERGLPTQTMSSLVDVMKAVRIERPRAVLVDLSSIGAGCDPHARMGPDHIMRVLRQSYPDLCIVALAATAGVRIQELSREFGMPLISRPFGPDQLIAMLESCGVIKSAVPTIN